MGRLLLCAILTLPAWAAEDVNPEEVIRKFAARESQFQRARENYTYRQTVKIQELDYDGNPHGKYEIVSDIVFGPDGKRTERVVRAPCPRCSGFF